MKDKQWLQLLEVSVALEIVKMERDQCREKTKSLEHQLAETTLRAKEAEERLQETTDMLFRLSKAALSARYRSTASEVIIDGRSVLRLEHPIIEVD